MICNKKYDEIGLFVFSYIFYHQRNEVEEKAHKAPFH